MAQLAVPVVLKSSRADIVRAICNPLVLGRKSTPPMNQDKEIGIPMAIRANITGKLIMATHKGSGRKWDDMIVHMTAEKGTINMVLYLTHQEPFPKFSLLPSAILFNRSLKSMKHSNRQPKGTSKANG